jgi:hypothetical protein
MTTALEGGEGSASRPGRSLPLGKTWYPLYRRLGGPQDQSGQVRKISLPPGFDPWTVQPVARRYADYATRPTKYMSDTVKTDLHTACRAHAVPLPCRALIQTCHAAPLPCSDSAVSFVKARVVAGNIRTANPTV